MITSFRGVFRDERRLHRIGDKRIPVPDGVPYAAIGWFAATLITMLILRRLPLLGEVIGLVPLPIRYTVVPGAVAWGMLRLRPDGRHAHRLVASAVRWSVSAKRIACFRKAETPGTQVRLSGVTLTAAREPVPVEGA